MELIAPTQFIRRAALKTQTIPVAMGKVVQYQDVPLVEVQDEQCWLCGGPIGGRGQPTKKAIKDTFTDIDKARVPASRSVCPGCAFCLSFRELRNYSILATEQELRHPTRAEIRDILLNPPKPPFVICIAVSGQKYLTFKAEVAYNRNFYPVQMEDTRIIVDVTQLSELLDLVERLYTVFSKDEIRTGRYSQGRIKEFGISRFQELEERLAPHRGSRLFDLAIFVAQKKEFDEPAQLEREENVCTTTLTPSIKEQQLQLF
ncbi:MAG: hypothetical protein ACOY9Y_06665 [Bacillota bacterium]